MRPYRLLRLKLTCTCFVCTFSDADGDLWQCLLLIAADWKPRYHKRQNVLSVHSGARRIRHKKQDEVQERDRPTRVQQMSRKPIHLWGKCYFQTSGKIKIWLKEGKRKRKLLDHYDCISKIPAPLNRSMRTKYVRCIHNCSEQECSEQVPKSWNVTWERWGTLRALHPSGQKNDDSHNYFCSSSFLKDARPAGRFLRNISASFARHIDVHRRHGQERTVPHRPCGSVVVWAIDPSCFRNSARKMDISEGHPLLLDDVPELRKLLITNLNPPK